MSKSLNGMTMDVHVDDMVVGLRGGGARDVAVVHPPVILPCEACLCGHGSPGWWGSSVPPSELRLAQEIVMGADEAPGESEA